MVQMFKQSLFIDHLLFLRNEKPMSTHMSHIPNQSTQYITFPYQLFILHKTDKSLHISNNQSTSSVSHCNHQSLSTSTH